MPLLLARSATRPTAEAEEASHDSTTHDDLDRTSIALGRGEPRLQRAATRAIAPARQPVHTVYGGAHLYKAETTRRLGELALRSLASYAPDRAGVRARRRLRAAEALASADAAALRARSSAIRPRFAARAPRPGWRSPSTSACAPSCAREPVEDFRIDFEDGFGARPDAEEDATAAQPRRARWRAAWRAGSLPPFIGIRIKSFGEEWKRRGARTLELFVDTLLAATRRPAARQLRRHAAQGHDPRAAAHAGAHVRAARAAPRPAGRQRCAWS